MVEWYIFTFNSANIRGIFLFDWISTLFVGVVLFISACIIYYSGGYIAGDRNYERFFCLVLLFVGSIVLMILSPNCISILLGWDGLGLVSYCLVIYYQNNKSYNAGMITILSNRVGDIGLLIGIGWLIRLGDWNIYLLSFRNNFVGVWVSVCILFAGITKSAQVPFSAWLPAAMAAPTPVSALVHSSTLVTAGVYLFVRFYYSINCIDWLIQVLFYLAVITSFMAGVGAIFEYDLKKIIALSTLSQLGLIVGAVAIGATVFAFCHLLTHALFKALLFMCAGRIIHTIRGLQDIRAMGALVKQLPIRAVCFNISNLALCGVPFLAGFYSRDLILEWGIGENMNMLIIVVLFLATGLTCCYSFRVSWYTSGFNYNHFRVSNSEDNDVKYSSSMMFLVVGAVFSGALVSWVLFSTPECNIIGFSWKVVPMGLIIGGVISGCILVYSRSKEIRKHTAVFLSTMWFMPYIFRQIFIKDGLELGVQLVDRGDIGWREVLGGEGLNYCFIIFGVEFQLLQKNTIKLFIFMFLSWTGLYILLLVYLFSLKCKSVIVKRSSWLIL